LRLCPRGPEARTQRLKRRSPGRRGGQSKLLASLGRFVNPETDIAAEAASGGKPEIIEQAQANLARPVKRKTAGHKAAPGRYFRRSNHMAGTIHQKG
jgi:hypothetical protein